MPTSEKFLIKINVIKLPPITAITKVNQSDIRVLLTVAALIYAATRDTNK